MSSEKVVFCSGLPEPVRALDTVRVQRIAAMLSESPRGMGRPISDREAWERLGQLGTFRRTVDEARGMLAEPLPELTEDIYLDHVRTGGEEVYNRYGRTVRSRFSTLIIAECVENQGRFLPAIHEAVAALCEEPTWVHAFHDPQLRNWRGEAIEIDLNSASVGWSAATAHYFLGERLDGGARSRLLSELSRRVHEPYRRMLDGGRVFLNQPVPFSWLEVTHNWNATALAHVTGAALATVEGREARAVCVAAAERYIRNFISGFPEDGSCSEGVGYWSGGFGSFLLLAETLWQATGGEVDLLDDERVELVAQYGARMEIVPGVYPVFADCVPGVVPSSDVMRFVSRRYGLGLSQWEEQEPEASTLQFVAVHAFANSSDQVRVVGRRPADRDATWRSWFGDAGLYVGRPAAGRDCVMGTSFKGGCNAEHHNHNDLGSFVVAVNGKTVLADPGAEYYTARTFGPNRYESSVLNSYGHPVPVVGDRLQLPGGAARAAVVRTGFGPEEDTVAYDMRAGYDVPALVRLTRTFVFSRRGPGSLSVLDEVEFDEPTTFGTALIAFGEWTRVAPDTLRISADGESVRVRLEVNGGPFQITAEEIKEDVRVERRPIRIGINLVGAVTEASIRATITPGDGSA